MSISTQVFSLKTRKVVMANTDDLDEDSMLTEEDKRAKTVEQSSDCRTQKKACANCTCG
ncbi:Anamorsin-like protein 1, partial [Diplonema papillatum]